MENKKSRIKWIDISKAIAIIMVGIGHYNNNKLICNWIYTFHIPLFFFLSGVTFNVNKKFIVFIKNKLCKLILPYALFSIAYVYFQHIVVYGISGVVKVNNVYLIKCIFINWRGVYSPIFWFIPALFICEIFMYLLIKYVKNNYLLFFIVIIFWISQKLYYCHYGVLMLPWDIDLMGITLFFLIVGYLYYKGIQCISINIKKYYIITLSFVTITIISLFNGKVDYYFGEFKNYILFTIGSVAGIIFIIMLSNIINSKLLSYIGKNSLYFYLLQNFMEAFSSKILNLIGINSSYRGFYICLNILICFTSIPIVMLITKLQDNFGVIIKIKENVR